MSLEGVVGAWYAQGVCILFFSPQAHFFKKFGDGESHEIRCVRRREHSYRFALFRLAAGFFGKPWDGF
jgi:hypothetical protein